MVLYGDLAVVAVVATVGEDTLLFELIRGARELILNF